MTPYQERVIDEKTELDNKLEKLKKFFGSEDFGDLENREIELLLKQATIMESYSFILAARIANF